MPKPFLFLNVLHAGGAPARSCEGRTGPSLHPPHPWPTLYSLDEYLYLSFLKKYAATTIVTRNVIVEISSNYQLLTSNCAEGTK